MTLGRYYEDFAVGDHYQHPLGRTITDADNTWFTLLTMNTNQNHFNADFAERAPYGKVIVNSGFTVALVLGLSVGDTSQNAIMNLSWDRIDLTHPLFVGDTVYAESLVLAKRESKSRPYAGIVTCKTRGLNQDGDECVSWTRTFMVYKRDAPHDKDYFPRQRPVRRCWLEPKETWHEPHDARRSEEPGPWGARDGCGPQHPKC